MTKIMPFTKPRFLRHSDVVSLTKLLEEVQVDFDVSWLFTPYSLTVVLNGKTLVFTHPIAAKAGLEMFLMGYDAAFEEEDDG